MNTDTPLTAETEKVKRLREALDELHEYAFRKHGLDGSWVTALNSARATLEATK